MGKYCTEGCSHLVTFKDGDKVVTEYKCSSYLVPNPKVKNPKKYKHWGRSTQAKIARTLEMENGKPVKCKKCMEDD
jgi:hypothetical protein